jgi:hypothetical protein
MKKYIFGFIFLCLSIRCASAPAVSSHSEGPLSQKTVSQVAQEWMDCPPPNPRRPSLCKEACCGDGSNWFVSCITFVGEISRAANGHVDPEILSGYSKNPPHEYGDPMLTWKLMVAKGRGHSDLSSIEPGSAVFFKIPTFPRGHIAIYTGEKNDKGEPLIITTGGFKRKEIRKESAYKIAREVNAEILGWAKIK